jgi:hypothetical protein
VSLGSCRLDSIPGKRGYQAGEAQVRRKAGAAMRAQHMFATIRVCPKTSCPRAFQMIDSVRRKMKRSVAQNQLFLGKADDQNIGWAIVVTSDAVQSEIVAQQSSQQSNDAL